MTHSTILIVDDDRNIRLTLDQFLAVRNYEPTTIDSGTAALTLLRETPFDLLLLDLHLRQMNGLDVLQQAVDIQPDLKVIVISGHATLDEAVTAMKLGACDFVQKPTGFIQKPFTPEELCDAIEAALQDNRRTAS
ncbi:MAG: response regulator [Leptolyngbya sp. SIO4C1]|nr:response regulator [Leptolyngbya sp. SIO4C1]